MKGELTEQVTHHSFAVQNPLCIPLKSILTASPLVPPAPAAAAPSPPLTSLIRAATSSSSRSAVRFDSNSQRGMTEEAEAGFILALLSVLYLVGSTAVNVIAGATIEAEMAMKDSFILDKFFINDGYVPCPFSF